MQLDCPQCRQPNTVQPQPAKENGGRLACVHCGAALVLDSYSGRLLVEKKTAGRRQPADRSASRQARRSRPFFQPRLATGRDIPAMLFVLTCLIAIAVGGWSLLGAVRSTDVAWTRFDPSRLAAQMRGLVEHLISGDAFRGPDDGRRALARGRALLQKASYAEALRQFDLAVERSSNPYEAHFWRGRALIKMGREAEAVEAFQESIAGNPRYSYAYDNLGWIHLRRGDYQKSLVYLDRSLALRPDNGWAYYNRGRVHLQLGDEDKALQDAETACRLGFEKACEVVKPEGGNAGN